MTADLGGQSVDGCEGGPGRLEFLRDIELKIGDLKAVQSRLGTSAEKPEDLERARELAHRINNLLTAYRLNSELGEGGADI
jgi:hypothetical protein